MKYVIWGIGIRGKMLFKCLCEQNVVAIVDNNHTLIGEKYKDIPIISFEQYIEQYSYAYLLVTPTVAGDAIVKQIKDKGITRYLDINRCPKELPGWEGELPYEEMLQPIIDKMWDKIIVLYGVNLFAILLYDYLEQQGYRCCFADIPEQYAIIDDMKLDGEYKVIDLKNLEKHHFLILKTDSYLDKMHKNKVSTGIEFYRFPYLKKYDYFSLQKLHNIHKGERCFIVATGPSLSLKDLEVLHRNNEICLSMNYVYRSFGETSWRPKYYFWEDTFLDNNILKEIKNTDVEYKFISDRKIKMATISNDGNVYFYREYQEYFGIEGPEFSDDIEKGTFWGLSVLYQCLQFAVYMGFLNIYIIGADLSYNNFGGDGDHFIKNYYDKKTDEYLKKGYFSSREDALNTTKIFKALENAHNYALKHKINIYNATRGGKLDIYPRVSFDSLFA